MHFAERFSWRAHAEAALALYRRARGENVVPLAAA
jgi:hypothetical protein